ncbi:MAG: hypothetical protein WBA87_15685 [Microbacterium sp.]
MSDAAQEPEETQDSIHESDPNTEPAGGEEPSTEDLEEPSTEKEVGEEPKAEKPHDPEPSHHAVGIGVIGGPQSIADELDDE